MAKSRTSTRKNNIKIVLLILGVAILSILASFAIREFFFVQDIPFDTYTLDYDFQVIDEVVFNLDDDIMHFGGGSPGSKMERSINLTSQKDARVLINWQGPGFISVDKNDFFIQENVSEMVTFYLKVPENLEMGNYTGKFLFSFYEK